MYSYRYDKRSATILYTHKVTAFAFRRTESYCIPFGPTRYC